MNLLIPIPVRPSLSPAIYDRFSKCLEKLQARMRAMDVPTEVVYNREAYKRTPGDNFFARFARLRNDMVDSYLRGEHTDVLWVDPDIIEFPPDLPVRLRERDAGIVSPIVLIEGTRQNYDTAGMREDYEERSNMHEPWFDAEGPLVELYATGACALVPAEVHRQVQFAPQPPDDPTWNTEWTELCEGARVLGYRTHVATDLPIYHADLPEYGEQWH